MSFRVPSPTIPLLVDGVKWNKLWRDPMMPELAATTDSQFLAKKSDWAQRLSALLGRVR